LPLAAAGFVGETAGFVEETAGFVGETAGFVGETAGSVEEIAGFVEETTGFVEEIAGFARQSMLGWSVLLFSVIDCDDVKISFGLGQGPSDGGTHRYVGGLAILAFRLKTRLTKSLLLSWLLDRQRNWLGSFDAPQSKHLAAFASSVCSRFDRDCCFFLRKRKERHIVAVRRRLVSIREWFDEFVLIKQLVYLQGNKMQDIHTFGPFAKNIVGWRNRITGTQNPVGYYLSLVKFTCHTSSMSDTILLDL
jgi:hypothetical protein